MDRQVSYKLQERLSRIAEQRGQTLESLLATLADRLEEKSFPNTLHHFFENAVIPICVGDPDGRLVYVNPTLCRTLGYKREEMEEHFFRDFIHPDDRPKTMDTHAQVVNGQPVTRFENRYRHKNGSYHWLSWSVVLRDNLVYAIASQITDQKIAASKLRAALDQNERILRSIFDGYLLGNTNGEILDVNQTYCDMLGYTRGEIIAKTVYEIDAAMSEQAISNLATQITAQTPSTIETQHIHKDGHPVDVEISSIQIGPHRIACFIRDITQRKQLEKQLRHNEQLYRGLIESQIDFVCRYTIDTTLTYVNDAYCQYFGMTREQLIGSSFLDLTPDFQTSHIYDRIEQVIQDPAPDVRTFYIYNAEGEKSWIQWVDYGLTDEDGNVTEIQAIGRDVTPLIEAQQEIADREKMLSTIFNNIPIMLTQFDDDGNFEYVNRHWVDVLGWPIEDIQAHPDFLSAIATTAEQRDEIFEYMMSGHIGWEDFTLRVRDGSLIETSWANVRLSDNRYLGIGQVISHRKELENQRVYTRQLEIELEKERELRELKDRFVSMVSHEFRTPLSVMTTSLDLVTRYHDRLSKQRIEEKLSVVSQQVQRMVRLMDDVLRFSKGEAGKTSFVPQSVPVIPFCNQVVETLKITDNAKHDIVINGDEGSIMADPRLLDHIISNLISNALKYSPQDTQITVAVEDQTTHWQFKISDQGIGIPEEDIPNLFDPFYRSDNVHHLPGTGLGLSIVKDYVRMHNGTIDIESEVDRGTTFIITLPSEQNAN